jgi:hypothetical protein
VPFPSKGSIQERFIRNLGPFITRIYSSFRRSTNGMGTFATGESTSRMIQGLGDPPNVIWLRQFHQCHKNVCLHRAGFFLDTSGLPRRRAREFCRKTCAFKSSVFYGSHVLLMPHRSEIVLHFAASFWSYCTKGRGLRHIL